MWSAAEFVLQSPRGLWMKTRTNAHRLRRSCGEKGTVQILSEDESPMATYLKGIAPNPYLDRLLLFLLGLTSKKDLLSIT